MFYSTIVDMKIALYSQEKQVKELEFSESVFKLGARSF